ncbi:co-chaperone GroES [Aquimarina celericrescens]|uniref:Co-chaperonin GroES n=1 Tax=Aquimarina celericrescens TaxID=1964542 RepID=A0ABW5B0E8_9FLAO|nr:co-chaperone GroES [Aquimarina celericrescens]
MRKYKIQPLSDWVFIKVDIAEEKSGEGIIIPDTAKEKPQKGIILAIGKGKKDDPMTVKVGDTVLYGKYSGTEITIEGINALIMKESDIFGIIQPTTLELT